MGDSGSNLLGLLLGCIAVQGTLKTNALIALVGPLVILAVPFLDTRLRGGQAAQVPPPALDRRRRALPPPLSPHRLLPAPHGRSTCTAGRSRSPASPWRCASSRTPTTTATCTSAGRSWSSRSACWRSPRASTSSTSSRSSSSRAGAGRAPRATRRRPSTRSSPTSSASSRPASSTAVGRLARSAVPRRGSRASPYSAPVQIRTRPAVKRVIGQVRALHEPLVAAPARSSTTRANATSLGGHRADAARGLLGLDAPPAGLDEAPDERAPEAGDGLVVVGGLDDGAQQRRRARGRARRSCASACAQLGSGRRPRRVHQASASA